MAEKKRGMTCEHCGKPAFSFHNPIGYLVICHECYQKRVDKYVRETGKTSLTLEDMKIIFKKLVVKGKKKRVVQSTLT